MKVVIPSINDPEVNAMLQALYSRSHISITKHLDDLGYTEPKDDDNSEANKLKSKVKQFYIGYGHASIADCGTTTVFIEDVSILAAKAIQDNPLYSGQESSTRYIDFSSKSPSLKAIINTYYRDSISDETHKYIDNLLDDMYFVYTQVFNEILDGLMNKSDKDSLTSNDIRALKARTFDITRGLLPCGTTTQLSIHGSLRMLRDHFKRLVHHPFNEVRSIAQTVLKSLYEKYPNTFKKEDYLEVGEDIGSVDDFYNNFIVNEDATSYHWVSGVNNPNRNIHFTPNKYSPINSSMLNGLIGSHITARDTHALDYGSWRDLQRHRNGYCMPTLPKLPWSKSQSLKWYTSKICNSLSPTTLSSLISVIDRIHLLSSKLHNLNADNKAILMSYILPLFTPVDTTIIYSLEQWKYLLNLRVRDTVHPTLVNYLVYISTYLSNTFPNVCKDFSKYRACDTDTINSNRGKHTILIGGKELKAID